MDTYPLKRMPIIGGLNSLRGRFLAVAALFACVLVVVAWLMQEKVQTTAASARANTEERGKLRKQLQELTNNVWQMQRALQDFLLVPDTVHRDLTLHNIEQIHAHLHELDASGITRIHPNIKEVSDKLHRSVDTLRRQAKHLMDVRVDFDRLYPASPILVNEMLPSNTEVYTQAGLAMNEAVENMNLPAQYPIYRAFGELRYNWVRMVGSFRVYISNRFGIFGDPKAGMAAQSQNIRMFMKEVDRYVARIGEFEKKGLLEFQQSESLNKIREATAVWKSAHEQASKIYNSDHWRSDIPILKNDIYPLLARIWTDLLQLESYLQAFAVEDVNALTGIADMLSSAIWVLGLLGIATLAGGLLLFEHTMRRPVSRVAAALKAEARGLSGDLGEHGDLEEVRDLVEAFNEMQYQVHSRQKRLESILDNAAEGIITFDETGRIESFNNAAEKLFGYKEAEILSKDLSLLIPPRSHDRREGYLEHFMRNQIQQLIGHEGEVIGRHKDGASFPMALKISCMEIEGRKLYTGLVADISERKAMLDHLKQMAEHDGLTGLYNRSYFQEELERVVERANRGKGGDCAVLYIDLDNFKYINDTMGHAAGDELLIEVAAVLQKRVRKSDLIARFGGDEFTVLLFDTPPQMAVEVADSFRRRMIDYSFRFGGSEVDVGCSIGVAPVHPGTESADEALSQADFACNLAKRKGRNRVYLFRPEDQDNVATMSLDMGWSRRIKEALDRGRFALACQPIVNTQTRRVECYEVLIRMLDENDEMIMPGGFLPSAERFGLAADIDKWVIIHAIDTLVEQHRTASELRYAINLSGQTLSDLHTCDLIHRKLSETGLDPAALTFEVTETVAIADMAAAVAFLSRLQMVGCKTALDDFGAGMSSFAYLKDLPVDIVKIDGRFVKNLSQNPVDQAMVKAMNEIAHALGKETVAEFVENEAAMELLAEFGVDYGQGFHLGRPDLVAPCQAIGRQAGLGGACQV